MPCCASCAPAIGGQLRESLIGLGLLQIRLRLRESGLRLFDCGARLIQLLVHFRRIDFRENLPGLHAFA